MGIDTLEVLEPAGTKWNFLPFRPGLVGGHCIGVDPYYLTHKAQTVGHHPEVILAGRRLNDNMGAHIVSQLVKAILKKCIHVEGGRVLILGLAFKENCPDLRNTRVIDILSELCDCNVNIDVHDPWVVPDEVMQDYKIELTQNPEPGVYDAIIVAVAHSQFIEQSHSGLRAYGKEKHIIYDIRHILNADESDLRL